jgi:type IV pilus assembly protein PilQ
MRTHLATLLSALALTSPLALTGQDAPAVTAPVPESVAAPAEAAPAAPAAPVEAKAETLSVDFPDEDIRTILRNVADLFELNVVIPDTLQGRTSIKLRDVTWRQIYQTVLSQVGYTFLEEGNIIKVVSQETLAQEPVTTEVFIANYARAEDIKKTIETLVDPAAGGRVIVDARSNALVISERPSRMAKIRPIIDRLDKATDQVMIESKFVEVSNSDIKNIGVNWASLNGYKASVGNLEAKVKRDRGQTSGETYAAQVPPLTNKLVNLTNTGAIARTASAVFTADEFGLVLSALKTQGNTKLVSNPTVVTLNNTEATINIGEEFPIPNYTYNQERGTFEVSGFEYRPIGIILKVKPQVNAQGFIKLAVEPEVSSRNGTTTFGGAGGAEIPIIATRKSKTEVSLKDGFTMGIGGLIENKVESKGTKVPVLGSIPGVGRLFTSRGNDESARNLLIFITAKTISPDGAEIGQIFDPRAVRGMGLSKDELPGFRDGSDPFVTAAPAEGK